MDPNESAAMAVLDSLMRFTDQNPSKAASVPSLAETCHLSPGDTDAAIAWLEARRAVRAIEGAAHPPFHYAAVTLMPQGRNVYRELLARNGPASDSAEHVNGNRPRAMVTAVRVERLRGVYEGHLEDLTPFTVLVGPNGSGKSTVLEAIHLAAARSDQDPFGPIWQERPFIQDQTRWLHWRGSPGMVPTVSVTTHEGRQFTWQILPHGQLGSLIRSAVGEGATGDTEGIGRVSFLRPPAPNLSPAVAEQYSEAVIGRGVLHTVEMVQRLFGAYDIRLLLEKDRPTLFLSFLDYAIPVAAAGAGGEWLVHLGLGLILAPGSLALVEEPEVHLHPKAIWEAARAIFTAVRGGVQVVLSTHSLELIDALNAEAATDEELDVLSVYLLALREGRLVSSRTPGREVAFLRGTIEEDLR